MATSDTLTSNVEAELVRRHKSTATTVLSLLVAVVLLCVLAFVTQKFLRARNTESLDMVVRISIVIFGFGAIALRRTKFAKMRLQDIAAIQGASGLIITLERTTILVALIGIAIALIGFVSTLVTANPWYTLQAGIVAAAVLLYGYPVRKAWEQAVRQFSSPDSDLDSLQKPS
jgi:intracellular septation protein A